jgi:hypothetical protein
MTAAAASLLHFLARIAARADRIVDARAAGRSPADTALLAARRVGKVLAGLAGSLAAPSAHNLPLDVEAYDAPIVSEVAGEATDPVAVVDPALDAQGGAAALADIIDLDPTILRGLVAAGVNRGLLEVSVVISAASAAEHRVDQATEGIGTTADGKRTSQNSGH